MCPPWLAFTDYNTDTALGLTGGWRLERRAYVLLLVPAARPGYNALVKIWRVVGRLFLILALSWTFRRLLAPRPLVTLDAPQSVVTAGMPGNSAAIPLFITMTLHFIPEPGLLLLLGSGVVGLGLLGRRRLKK